MGLAPAANGGNRTGRIFTGDRSGDWLFASLHRVGLATQPTSVHAGDGLRLVRTRMVGAVRCAPPDEQAHDGRAGHLRPLARAEVTLVAPSVRAVVCLGSFGWAAALRTLRAHRVRRAPAPAALRPRGRGRALGARRPHGAAARQLPPSQQNTFTGKLHRAVLDAVLGRAARSGSGRLTARPRIPTAEEEV